MWTSYQTSKTKAIVINIKSEMRSFKNNENIHKKEGGSYYVACILGYEIRPVIRVSAKIGTDHNDDNSNIHSISFNVHKLLLLYVDTAHLIYLRHNNDGILC